MTWQHARWLAIAYVAIIGAWYRDAFLFGWAFTMGTVWLFDGRGRAR